MSTSLDWAQYCNLSLESFTTVPPSPVVTLDPPFLVYSEDLSLMVCTLCREALSGKTAIQKHLAQPPHQEYWKALEKSTRTSIMSTLSALSLLSYHSVPSIPTNQYYFPQLPLRFDTYKCPDCSHFTVDGKQARQHRIHAHNVRWDARTKRTDILYHIPAQLLFPRSNRGLFIPRLPLVAIYSTEVALPISQAPRSSRSSSRASSLSTTVSSPARQGSTLSAPSSSLPPANASLVDLLTPYLEKEQRALAKMSTSENLTSKNKSSFLRNSR